MGIESISGVTLLTSDMEGSYEFYDRLGFRLRYGGPDAEFTSFNVGSGYLNLQLEPGWSGLAAIWGRVIFWVDDVDALHAAVLDAGYEPSTSPEDALWGERYFHVTDPAGHELSFARPLHPGRLASGG